MLDDTLGKRRAVARVSTKMDFDANSTESKVYAPQGTVLSRNPNANRTTERSRVRQPAIGVPGTTSNIGTYQARAAANGNGRYNKSKSTTNYDISEQNIKHIDAPGKVLQTSVAVLVIDGAPVRSGTARCATAAPAYQLTPANVQQIRNVVIAAAGLNLAQGDQVSVEACRSIRRSLPVGATSAGTTTVLGVPLWALIALGGVGLLAGIGFLAMRAPPLAVLADQRSAVLRLVARRRAAAVRRTSDARRRTRYRRADSFRSRSDARADDRIRHDRRSRKPRQHRKTRQAVAGGVGEARHGITDR